MTMYIDIGNQRIKWLDSAGLHAARSPQALEHQKANWVSPLRAAWQGLPSPKRVIMACVAGADIAQQVIGLVQELWAIEVEMAHVARHQAGLKIDYQPLTSLGVDRYYAMQGALALTAAPVLVVNAGTAVTIDCVLREDDASRFAGGVIMPGLQALVAALYGKTARIAPLAHDINWQQGLLNQSSQDSVSGGVVNMLCFAVQGALSEHLKQYPGLAVVFSGGDAKPLMARMSSELTLDSKQVMLDEALVLRGMQRIYEGL